MHAFLVKLVIFSAVNACKKIATFFCGKGVCKKIVTLCIFFLAVNACTKKIVKSCLFFAAMCVAGLHDSCKNKITRRDDFFLFHTFTAKKKTNWKKLRHTPYYSFALGAFGIAKTHQHIVCI